MHSHVCYKLQVKVSFLAIWVGTICLFQAFINFIIAAENTTPKLSQFYASNRELTPVFHFHLPVVSNAKSIICMAAFSERVNRVFFSHIESDFFFPKNRKPPHFVSQRKKQCLFLSQNFTKHFTWHSRAGTSLSSSANVLIHFAQSLNRNWFHAQVCLFWHLKFNCCILQNLHWLLFIESVLGIP